MIKTKLGVKARQELTEAAMVAKVIHLLSKQKNKITVEQKGGDTKYSVGISNSTGRRTFYSVKYDAATKKYEVWMKGKKVSLGPNNSKRVFNLTKSQYENRKDLEKSIVGENKKWGLFGWLNGRKSK